MKLSSMKNNAHTITNGKPLSVAQYFSVFILGFTTLVIQILLLRKFLSVFNGNELVLGIIMANWMLLTGLGARTGKYLRSGWLHYRSLSAFHVILGLLPILTVWGIYWSKWQLMPHGQMISIFEIFYISALLLLPFCFISGMFFTFLSGMFSHINRGNIIHKAYSAEAQGSIAGGIFINGLLILLLREHYVFVFLALLNLGFSFFIAWRRKQRMEKVILLLLITGTGLFAWKGNIEQQGLEWLYRGQTILDYRDTPYGRLVVTEKEGEHYMYENNIMLAQSSQPVKNEENVHYAMLQHPNPQQVLVVSGGITGALDEINKYQDVKRIDYVELNPWIVKYGKKHFGFTKGASTHIINKDARLYIRETDKLWDVVLLNLPAPETAQLNRFYTTEFFREIKQQMHPDAVISLSLPSPGSYMGEEAIEFHSIIYNTLNEAFKHVRIIPDGSNYMLASDAGLTTNIASEMAKRDFKTRFVNPYYLNDELISEKSRQLEKQINPNTRINKDFKPIAYFEHLKYWLSFFEQHTGLYYGLLAALFLFLVFRTDYVQISMFTAGFTGAGMEVILLLAFQVIFGYVYITTGAFLTVFMAGLAVASWTYPHRMKSVSPTAYMKVQGLIAVFALTVPGILLLMQSKWPADWMIHGVFYLLTFLIAFLIGLMFSQGVTLQEKHYRQIAGNIYSIDLIGSALGALLIASFLIPLWGFYNVCWFLAAINLLAIGNTFFTNKYRPAV